MKKLLPILILLLMVPITAYAQLRPGSFSTLVVYNASDSTNNGFMGVGCGTPAVVSSTSCKGYINTGSIYIANPVAGTTGFITFRSTLTNGLTTGTIGMAVGSGTTSGIQNTVIYSGSAASAATTQSNGFTNSYAMSIKGSTTYTIFSNSYFSSPTILSSVPGSTIADSATVIMTTDNPNPSFTTFTRWNGGLWLKPTTDTATFDMSTKAMRVDGYIVGSGTQSDVVTFASGDRMLLGPVSGSDYGAARGGSYYLTTRNSNGSGAAGGVGFTQLNGTKQYVWVDGSGNARVSSSLPEADGAPSDTSGTVIGTQTSMKSTKNIEGLNTDQMGALAAILRAPVYNFTYRSGAYNNTHFVGITTDDSPEFGMDEGRSFNPVSAFGYTVLAIKELERRIAVLEAK